MKIIHNWQNNRIQQEASDNVGFLLTDQQGSWLSLASQPANCYQGWFVTQHQKPFKVLDDLRLVEGDVQVLSNRFWSVERQTGAVKEYFWLNSQPRALIYELSQPSRAEIVLDFKEPSNNQSQASYQCAQEQGFLVAKCSLPNETVFLVCKSDTGKYFPLNQTLKNVFRLAQWEGQKLVLAVGATFSQAQDIASKVFKDLERLKKREQSKAAFGLKDSQLSRGDPTIKMAYSACCHALTSLALLVPGQEQIYAGLPWFFQFWGRDAAMSLVSLCSINAQLGLKVFWRLMQDVKPQGFLPKIIQAGQFSAESADGLGWLAKAAEQLWGMGCFNDLKPNELQELKERFCGASHGLVKNHTKAGLVVNEDLDTWMNSLGRRGPSLENQALALALYHSIYQLTQNNYYWLLETELKNKTREHFWNGQEFLDAGRDNATRPNVFLAAYLYPELLKKEEWIKCFQNILPRLWLEWGGLATVDTGSSLFQPYHSGQDSASHHNGDSLFYLNNLAALVLHRLDSRRFQFYIDKIFKASVQDILWQGAISHHSEMTWANKLQPQGCWSQASSAALFCELAKELYK